MIKLISIFVALLAAAVCQAADLETVILQYKLDRVYFPVGEESQVYLNATFVLSSGNDAIALGTIAFSGAGVSYSCPLALKVDTSAWRTWRAVIQIGEIDLSDTIRLGYVGMRPPVRNPRLEAMGSPPPADTAAQPIVLVPFSSQFQMTLDFESGVLDGFFAYSKYQPSAADNSLSTPAPYFTCLTPDIGSHAVDNAFITTSLYYRIDQSKYGVMFDGDHPSICNCLYGAERECARAYPYDPDRGRGLLRHLSDKTRKMRIFVQDNSLKPAALFLSDILSRDKLRTEIAEDAPDCAVRLVFVPYSDENGQGLGALFRLLVSDTMPGNEINKTVAIIGKYIELGNAAQNDSLKEKYYQLAEKSLLEDVGVFPLFRPRLYFTARNTLKGPSFDSGGAFDASRLVKIKESVRPPEVGQ